MPVRGDLTVIPDRSFNFRGANLAAWEVVNKCLARGLDQADPRHDLAGDRFQDLGPDAGKGLEGEAARWEA